MKNLVSIFFAMMMVAPAAFAMTKKELMGKTLTSAAFMKDVEESIKAIFTEPKKVVIKMSNLDVERANATQFYVEFEYNVKAGDVEFGYCTFLMLGEVKADSSVGFKKMLRQDCGS